MIQLAAQIRYSGHIPSELGQRQFNEIKRMAYEALAYSWHYTYLPLHFTVEGARKYQYAPRKGEEGGLSQEQFWRSYTGRKVKYLGHRKPLVKSGESQARATATPPRLRITVTSTRSRARVAIPAPTLNFQPRGSRIDMRREVTTVTDDELQDLARIFDRAVQDGIDEAR